MVSANYVPVSELVDRLTEVRKQIAELAIEENILKRLVERAVPVGVPNDPAQSTNRAATRPVLLPGPREAIIALVSTEPGMTVTEIASRLENQIASGAKDKKNVIRTTAANLVKTGELERSEAGGVYPKGGLKP